MISGPFRQGGSPRSICGYTYPQIKRHLVGRILPVLDHSLSWREHRVRLLDP